LARTQKNTGIFTVTQSNTDGRTFTHLSEIEQGQIAVYLDEDIKQREIAR